MVTNRIYNLAFNLSAHPVTRLSSSIKMDYMKVVGHFVASYSTAQSTFLYKIYGSYFLGKEETMDKLSFKELKKCIRALSCWHFRFWGIDTYRYVLVTDIFYMTAFDDELTAIKIMTELKSHYSSTSNKCIEQIFSFFYKNAPMPKLMFTENLLNSYKVNLSYCKLPKQIVAVVANVSAGKSTLINSLIGYPVVKTKNEACTSIIRQIETKAYEDGRLIAGDDNSCIMHKKEGYTVTEDCMNRYIGLYHEGIKTCKRLTIVDTPGINYSQNVTHSKITKQYLLKREWDILLVVLNGTNIGTDDDKALLEFIYQNFKSDRIIFVINKLDCFCPLEDSISDTMNKCRDDLHIIGFKDPELVPVSAYAALLAKRNMTGHSLNEEEEETLGLYQRKFKKDYYDFPSYVKREKSFEKGNGDNLTVLEKSNILFIEQLIAN